MATEGPRRQLEIVRSPKREHLIPDYFQEPKVQKNLFPSPKKGLVIFVHFPDVTEKEFRDALLQSQPGYIFEFRPAPRFDIGNLNRQLAFQLFSEQHANYVDLTYSSMADNRQDRVFVEFKSFAQNRQLSLDRPLMVLVTESEGDKEIQNQISEFISSLTSDTLEVFDVPHFSTT